MKKGLTLTLVMVAIALSGYHAMGRAPVVDAVPDIVVGDENSTTQPNLFVYPDAINLNSIVDDPDGSDDQIIWSFLEASGTYRINGVASQPASPTSATLVNPTNKIAGPGVTASDPADTNGGLTATIRNVTLSPIGGSNTDPGAAGIVAAATKVVTLFASDGSTYGASNEFMVYTDNNGNDRTSTGLPVSVPIVTWNFATSNNGWKTFLESGTVTFANSGGMCLSVPALGSGTPPFNGGEFQSPYGSAPTIDLVANSVWRCKITAHNSGNAAETVPMWMFLFDNAAQGTDVSQGANAYAGEYVFLDTPGQNSANTVGVSRTSFTCWITPVCVKTPQWNSTTTGGFFPAYDPYNDIRIRFRVFDRDDAGYGAATDLGAVCMDTLTIDRFNLTEVETMKGQEVFNQTPTTAAAAWHVVATGTTVTDSAGIQVAPTSQWANEVIKVEPGDGNLGDLSLAQVQDDYPIAWEANTLYMIEVVMSTPYSGAASGENQGDVIRIGMDCPLNELAVMSMVDNNLIAAGTPKSTASTYVAFFYSHNVSLTPLDTLKRLRPRIDILNSTNFSTGNGAGGLHGTKFGNVKVTKVNMGL